MAAFTTTQAGNWSAAATWGGSGPPGDGDTATVNHAVTVDANATVGTSPNDTTTVVLQLNATLTIAAGVTFTVKGNADRAASVGVILNAGATLTFDPSSSGGTPVYELQSGGTATFLQCNGTSGSRCTVQAVSGHRHAIYRGGLTGANYIEADYTDFIRGNAGAYLNSDLNASGAYYRLTFCTFDDCGWIGDNSLVSNSSVDFIVEDCNFSNPADTFSLYWRAFNVTGGTGTRSIQRNAFGGRLELGEFASTIFDDNFCNNGIQFINHGTAIGSFDGNFIREDDGGLSQAITWYRGVASNCYLLLHHSTSNPHGISTGSRAEAVTIDGWIFEYTGTDASGDMILGNSANADNGADVTIVNCIVLPNGGGSHSGTLLSLLATSGKTYRLRHNTVKTSSASSNFTGVVVAESYAGHADMVAEFLSNLFWSNTAADALKCHQASGAVQGIITEANCDYNAAYNVEAGSEGGGYNLDLAGAYQTDFGANDLDDTDPQFVDETRDLASWDGSLGGPGTVANALTELGKLNLPGHDPDYTIAALLAYVRGGFAPTNAAYDGSAHDAGTIGAVAYTSGGSPVSATQTHRAEALASVSGSQAHASEHVPGPNPPADVAITDTQATQVSISWTDTNNGGAVPVVYRRATPAADWEFELELPPAATAYTFLGLDSATEYDFGVAYRYP